LLSARQETDQLTGVGAANAVADARLFRALIEDLRTPLLQIARQSELARLAPDKAKNFDAAKQIETTADAALKMIDSYLFSARVLLGQQSLALEPVSVSATLQDTAQYMHDIAKLYDYRIEVVSSPRSGLVMANPNALQAALISLAYACIGGIASEHSRLILASQKTKQGITAGVMIGGKKISKAALHSARQTYGAVRQPLPKHSHTNSAGIYVADSLFAAMQSELKTKSLHGASGFVATLLPSYQLALL
jgi:K+-sensing histidine kinase KdpD